MTGIKRIYKNRAMVKRPERAERPTKGLRRNEQSDRSHGSCFKEVNEPGERGGICPNPGEYGWGVQPVGRGSSREYKTKLAGEVSGRHRAGSRWDEERGPPALVGGQERNHMFTALSSARHHFAHIPSPWRF